MFSFFPSVLEAALRQPLIGGLEPGGLDLALNGSPVLVDMAMNPNAATVTSSELRVVILRAP